jgi:hypothetical protein
MADWASAGTGTDDIEKIKLMQMHALWKILFNRIIIFLPGRYASGVLA